MARFRPAALFPLRTIACVASAVAVLASCSGGASTSESAPGPTLDASKITPACFQGGTAPELQLGSGFAGADWNDPHVLKVGAEYWMFASSNLGFPPAPASPVQIYRFTSTDAVNWTLNPMTPVLTVANGQWDQGGNETPAVVSFGGKYHMFWTGYPDGWPNLNSFNFRIGHATSMDGTTWTKDATFLLGPSGVSGDFNQYIVAEPGPVVFNNMLYLYFTAVGVDTGLSSSLQVVGVMTSADGVNWSSPPVLAFKPDQTVYPRGSNWVGYSTPNAVVIDGKVHVFVDVANDGSGKWTQVALQHASSADGLTGWTQDTAPIRRLADFTWTAREIRSPAAFLDGTTLRLYFAGDDIGNTNAWGIGQMTCSLAP
jgi:predicted GH43/DUF377 family glycosyl hydrolase